MSQGGLKRAVETFRAGQYLLVSELVAAASSAAVGGVVCLSPWSHMLMAPSWMPRVIVGAGVAADAGRVASPERPTAIMAPTTSNTRQRRARPGAPGAPIM